MNVVVIVVAIGAGVAVQLAALGRLRRNGILGIRTASVRRNDSTWVRGHRAAVWPVWATVGLTTGIEAASLIVENAELSVFLSWVGLAVLFVGTLAATLLASHAARTEADPARSREGKDSN